jgi:hypothetical protein
MSLVLEERGRQFHSLRTQGSSVKGFPLTLPFSWEMRNLGQMV